MTTTFASPRATATWACSSPRAPPPCRRSTERTSWWGRCVGVCVCMGGPVERALPSAERGSMPALHQGRRAWVGVERAPLWPSWRARLLANAAPPIAHTPPQVSQGLDVIVAITQVPTFQPNDNSRAFNRFADFIGAPCCKITCDAAAAGRLCVLRRVMRGDCCAGSLRRVQPRPLLLSLPHPHRTPRRRPRRQDRRQVGAPAAGGGHHESRPALSDPSSGDAMPAHPCRPEPETPLQRRLTPVPSLFLYRSLQCRRHTSHAGLFTAGRPCTLKCVRSRPLKRTAFSSVCESRAMLEARAQQEEKQH